MGRKFHQHLDRKNLWYLIQGAASLLAYSQLRNPSSFGYCVLAKN